MKKVLKKIGSVAIDVLIVIVFIISTIVVIASITANRTGGQPSVGGYVFSSVQTDSMQGTINKGDLVVGKLIDDSIEIKVGDIVSFEDYYEGQKITITHRVKEVRTVSDPPTYITQGDNEKYADDILRHHESIHSVYKFRIPFLGAFIDFLKTPLGFIICLVLPLLAFIAFQAYKLITLYLKAKKLELVEEASNGNNSSSTSNSKSELSEEEKNAIIAEYLAKQALEKEKAEKESADDKTDATSKEEPEVEEETEAKEETEVEEEPEAEEELEAEEETEVEEEPEAEEESEVEEKPEAEEESGEN